MSLQNSKINNILKFFAKLCNTLRNFAKLRENFAKLYNTSKNKTSISLITIILLFLTSCTNEKYSDLIETNTTLNLKFNAYLTSSVSDARLGLEWALQQIGAKTTNNNFNGIIQLENILTIDYEQLGFNENAKVQLEKLHQKIKNSQEYKITNTIDLGRYVTLIIGASEHYFKITGVPENIEDILENYTFKPSKGYVDNSLISFKHRIIEYSAQNELNQLFLTSEIEPSTGEVLEYETLEIMQNGHLRFGVFDMDGIRKNNATPSVSSAGKPAKCMWCHESNISQLFSVQNDFPEYLTYLELKDTLDNFTNLLNAKQLNLTNGIDFNENQNHAKMELLYISFMEPSAEVLSKEWNLTVAEVQNKLVNLQTHEHEEFTFLGELYHRNEVEEFSPFTSLKVSTSVREASEVEVNYID